MHAVDLTLAPVLPFCPDNVFGHLIETRVPGVEEWRVDSGGRGWLRRSLRLPHGLGIVALSPGSTEVGVRLLLTDPRDEAAAIERCRFVLDLDADAPAITDALRADPALAPLVDAHPGRRVPRAFDANEFAIRAVLGQQVSTAAARTHAARLAVAFGEPIDDPGGDLTHLFPEPRHLVDLPPQALAMPASRRTTIDTLARALSGGSLTLAASDVALAQLLALPGIGPWTAQMVAMRGLGDPDAFPHTDLGVVAGARSLGLPTSPGALRRHSERWRPWRAYAAQYLWATSPHAINKIPDADAP